MSNIQEFKQRIAEFDTQAIATLEILQKHCPIRKTEKITGNESFESVILRFINHFMLNTLTTKQELSIHYEEIKQILQSSINDAVIRAICSDDLLVKTIQELEDHEINSTEIINLITNNLTELPAELSPRKEEILDCFKYIKKK